MKVFRIVLFIYLLLIGLIFAMVYGGGLREMGLYVFIVILNLPASLVVEPWTESLATFWGFSIGAPPHIFVTQLACMVLNTILLFGMFLSLKWLKNLADKVIKK